MQQAVVNAWCPFNRALEGWVSWMYLDVKGLVTTGMGNLIDPIDTALALPWSDGNGQPASQDDIAAEWSRVKADTRLASAGAMAAGRPTQLRLADEDIEALVLAKLDSNVVILSRQHGFAEFENWPADAQLAALSMAWAMGPAFPEKYPHFSAATAAGDFKTAAAECEMDASANAGLVRRNDANREAFLLAVTAADPAVLLSAVPPA